MAFRDAEARRKLIQQVITHPDAIADLLLELLDRVEKLEWDMPPADRPTFLSDVREHVNGRLDTILRIDQVTTKFR